MKKLLAEPQTPAVKFLLQCADWNQDEWNSNKWVAYSPIYNRYTGGYWPIYDLDGLEVTEDQNEIEFHSWKGDYDPEIYHYAPIGNLDYRGKQYAFKGTIWTRG